MKRELDPKPNGYSVKHITEIKNKEEFEYLKHECLAFAAGNAENRPAVRTETDITIVFKGNGRSAELFYTPEDGKATIMRFGGHTNPTEDIKS